jgi:tetratricopeptide (TPR) repeat protein
MVNPGLLIQVPENIGLHLHDCVLCYDRVTNLYDTISHEPELIKRLLMNSRKSTLSVQTRLLHHRTLILSGVAAIIIVFMVVGIYLYLKPPSHEKLFTQNFHVYANILTNKGGDENRLSYAMLLYDLKEYDSAIIILNQLQKSDSTPSQVMFYLGNAYLAKGNADSAIYYLDLTTQFDNGATDASYWYLALAYLKNNNTEATKIVLRQLVSKGGYYENRAAELLRKLD